MLITQSGQQKLMSGIVRSPPVPISKSDHLLDGITGLYPGLPAAVHVFDVLIAHPINAAASKGGSATGLAIDDNQCIFILDFTADLELEEAPWDI